MSNIIESSNLHCLQVDFVLKKTIKKKKAIHENNLSF